jgi:cholesterol oxidase
MHSQVGWLSEDAHALQRRLAEANEKSAGQAGSSLHCDLLIVGSGYGGAIAAARLAQTTLNGEALRIIVLERGREYLAGMFPSRLADLPGHVRVSRQDGEPPRGPATALWDMRIGKDVNVVLGSGLGGGSLINAAVMARPEASVWESGWPSQIDGGLLEASYAEAERMLGANSLPHTETLANKTLPKKPLPKLEALQHLGDGLPDKPKVERCKLAISFEDNETPDAGVQQLACKMCGDCATGCNWQAKNSLDANYLALAKRRRVDMYCGVLAHRIERHEKDRWKLLWAPTDDSLGWAGHALPIHTRFLIVCAGSLGSTELLQRSQSDDPQQNATDTDPARKPRPRLQFSTALGSRFSTNGDMLAAAVKLPLHTQICGEETESPDGRNIGPTITGMLRSGQGDSRFVAQEFAIPAPLRTLLSELTGSLGMLQDMAHFDWSLHSPWKRGAEPLSPSQQDLDRTMVYGLMGDDGARGRLEPTRPIEDNRRSASVPTGNARPTARVWDGRIAVQWPEARYERVFDAQHEALSAAYGSNDRGWYLPNPGWRPLPEALDRLAQGKGVRGPLTTVHPLGGCPMGANVEQGVVDWAGRVFSSRQDDGQAEKFLKGLVVLDGSIIPRSLGINPALTIAALAEHAIPELIRDWGLEEEEEKPLKELGVRPVWKEPSPRPEQPSTAIRLVEKVQGTLELGGRSYWGEMQVRFAPIGDVAAFTRSLPRQAPFESVVLRLYADQRQLDDEPQWRAQRDVEVAPLFELQLSGHADVMFRHWSWFGCRVYRGFMNVTGTGAGSHLSLSTQLAIASNIGEQRGIDYLLHVDSVSHPACPLKPGDKLRGRKRIDNDLDSNPWRQVSQMEFQLRSGAGLFGVRYRRIGRLDLDLRYFVRQRTALLALHAQPDMVTALADVAILGLFCLRVLLKIQLLKFVPPEKRQRDIAARRPAELPGLTISRFDLRERPRPKKVLLTRYTSQVGPTKGWPIVLLHGFTASGSTFAHPTIQPNLVQFLCAERRDVWVAELPTSIAFEKREAKDLSFEEVADEIPAILAFVKLFTQNELSDKQEKAKVEDKAKAQVKVDVLGHCIGAAMVCRAVLRHLSLYRMVNSLTLSQVGPLIEMSPANQLRGYMASYLAQFLGVKSLDARPSFEPGGAEGLGQVLLDAALASLPYPERDRERALGQQAVDEGRPDFRLVRHRADAMLGRLFELTGDSTVAPDTLDQLDDILGYARVQTLAQIIHYTRLSMLTDNDGRNREVNNDAVARRMCFPVLLLHGRRSGVFDWRGSLESYEWLRQSHVPELCPADARVERNDEKLHMGLDTTRQLCVFEKFGHQDSMIGSRAAEVVFPVIGEFLRWVEAQQPTAPPGKPASGQTSKQLAPTLPAPAGAITGTRAPAPWVARVPWVGPIVGWLRHAKEASEVEVSLVVHPSPMHTATQFVALVPMRYYSGAWRREPQGIIKLWNDFELQPTHVEEGRSNRLAQFPTWSAPAFDVLGVQTGIQTQTAAPADEKFSGTGLTLEASTDLGEFRPRDPVGDRLRSDSITLRLKPESVDGVTTALLLLTVHNDLPQRPGRKEADPRLESSPPSSRDRRDAEAAVKRFFDAPPAGLESALLRLPQHVLDAKDRRNPGWKASDRTDTLTFAVASCQYPAGLLDRELAQSSYRRLRRRLDAPANPQRLLPPQLLLLLGDQVYVDETAGLFEPVTKDLAFDQIYDRNLGLPAFRAIASRLPTFMMLDDHEVRDNWQPPNGEMSEDDQKALQYFYDRQAGLNCRRPLVSDASYSFSFAPGGWPVFVLDTRTQRTPRTPENFDTATIIPEWEMHRLLKWLNRLERCCPGCPKFIASPSILLPFERDPKQRRWSSDGWAGFPASRKALLGGIARGRIRNVIFLSGDAHLSMSSEVELRWNSSVPVKVYSVVSSGLYAPWRFANAERCDYVRDGDCVTEAELSCTPLKTHTCEANGYAVVQVEREGQRHRLTVEFDTSAGMKRQIYDLPDAP